MEPPKIENWNRCWAAFTCSAVETWAPHELDDLADTPKVPAPAKVGVPQAKAASGAIAAPAHKDKLVLREVGAKLPGPPPSGPPLPGLPPPGLPPMVPPSSGPLLMAPA